MCVQSCFWKRTQKNLCFWVISFLHLYLPFFHAPPTLEMFRSSTKAYMVLIVPFTPVYLVVMTNALQLRIPERCLSLSCLPPIHFLVPVKRIEIARLFCVWVSSIPNHHLIANGSWRSLSRWTKGKTTPKVHVMDPDGDILQQGLFTCVLKSWFSSCNVLHFCP